MKKNFNKKKQIMIERPQLNLVNMNKKNLNNQVKNINKINLMNQIKLKVNQKQLLWLKCL